MNQFVKLMQENRFPLVVSLPRNNPELARAAWNNGADAVKIHINVKHHASNTQFLSFDEERGAVETILSESKGPMGIVLGGNPQDAAADFPKTVAAGFDFISLYGHHTPVEILGDLRISKMLAPDYTWEDWEIAGLQTAGADILEASVMHPDSYGQSLTAREIVRYRHLSHLSALPMVVPTQRAVKPSEVAALQNAGVKSVMVGAVVTGDQYDTISASVSVFRKAIDEMRGKP